MVQVAVHTICRITTVLGTRIWRGKILCCEMGLLQCKFISFTLRKKNYKLFLCLTGTIQCFMEFLRFTLFCHFLDIILIHLNRVQAFVFKSNFIFCRTFWKQLSFGYHWSVIAVRKCHNLVLIWINERRTEIRIKYSCGVVFLLKWTRGAWKNAFLFFFRWIRQLILTRYRNVDFFPTCGAVFQLKQI